ncbi:MAG: TdeIII family type II restriction endonuclease [Rickettsiales bacterium]|nr:TdeIII family type II restriction endonuclease [Rickettsiales bacterium]
MKESDIKIIKAIIKASVEQFAIGFEARHKSEINNPEGVINSKINNIFIALLGDDIRYYSALVRSLDSSLGNMLEKIAIHIAEQFYQVERRVEGFITKSQISFIAKILEEYKTRKKSPAINHYNSHLFKLDNKINKRHESDYYIKDRLGNHYLIELKIGGDLDNKKARSEKEALLEQYFILKNSLDANQNIKIIFATAYNRFGEDKEWKQERVKQFFANEELLISKDFWNFICNSEDGYNLVVESYKEYSKSIVLALNRIKKLYLKK